MNIKRINKLSLIFVILILTSCGGGGESSNGDSATPALTPSPTASPTVAPYPTLTPTPTPTSLDNSDIYDIESYLPLAVQGESMTGTWLVVAQYDFVRDRGPQYPGHVFLSKKFRTLVNIQETESGLRIFEPSTDRTEVYYNGQVYFSEDSHTISVNLYPRVLVAGKVQDNFYVGDLVSLWDGDDEPYYNVWESHAGIVKISNEISVPGMGTQSWGEVYYEYDDPAPDRETIVERLPIHGFHQETVLIQIEIDGEVTATTEYESANFGYIAEEASEFGIMKGKTFAFSQRLKDEVDNETGVGWSACAANLFSTPDVCGELFVEFELSELKGPLLDASENTYVSASYDSELDPDNGREIIEVNFTLTPSN